MLALECVDELYAAFCGTLPVDSVDSARRLAHTLKLVPSPDVPWSQVFGHEVTLAAPLLLGERMDVPRPVLHKAAMAHMLAVIEAFGTDRIEDGQVADTKALRDVLGDARRVRAQSLADVAQGIEDRLVDFPHADKTTLGAIRAEREIFESGEAVDFGRYERISIAKQSVGFPASMALAHAAGWSADKRRALHTLLEAIWVGLQLHDDVVDWQDDISRGGAWALSLARGIATQTSGRDCRTTPPLVRSLVLSSGVLASMLWRSRRRFRVAKALARALGAQRLASWAGDQERAMEELARNEQNSAGYSLRARALSNWAREVLA